MVKLNYLIFAVLICLAIVVSQVRCGGQDCDPSKVGSGIHTLYVEDEEMLNSLMNKKHIVKLTKAGRKNVYRKLTRGGRRNSKMLRRLVKRQVARKISHEKTEKRGRIGHSVHNKVSNNNKHAKTKVSNKKLHSKAVSSPNNTNKRVSDVKPRETRDIGKSENEKPAPIETKKTPKDVNNMTAQEIINQSIATFDGAVGPSNKALPNRRILTSKKGILKEQDEDYKRQQEKQEMWEPIDTSCVACRVDCMKTYSQVGGSIFESCKFQYYYYGCKYHDECFMATTTSDEKIKGMLGICLLRNGCKLKGEWNSYGVDDAVTGRLLGKLRASNEKPE
ncbi:predicted protein [Naegleria gruberi]|uniref:Predicted protein n=1 Tax=Naegleria gruberi TaxID=5762 RepID=D2VN74_NAEGR|nr:uncharacterized protein NAEGRDRAFT_50935 [Naegleria gruberi]EFC41603.1 predicted protein [Naegleria gruberi]|eukprot:XP_002674347.1 predicted protein [Naegleria gruberi strain NEG-M]